MDKKELTTTFMELVKYMAEHGELMKTLLYLENPPALIDTDDYLVEVKEQLNNLREMQDKGTLGGKLNVGFVDPDVLKLVAYKKLKEELIQSGVKKIVDVGCYTGWMGRDLSLEGIVVHGIDLHPVIIWMAALRATGTLATFEYLPVQKLGIMHPREFEAAVLFDILEHTFDPEIALESVNRSIKNGGKVYINLPHPEGEAVANISDLHIHEHLYNLSEKKIKEFIPNAEIEVIKNEYGTINWFISYNII
mgnify:CR=1 FL=1